MRHDDPTVTGPDAELIAALQKPYEPSETYLRDQFAAAALSGLVSTGYYSLPSDALAAQAYAQADAMLKARK